MKKYDIDELKQNYMNISLYKLTEEELRLLTNFMDYKLLCDRELLIRKLIREYPEYKTHFGLRLKQRLEEVQEELNE